jgi:hypothetical protein
MHRSRSDTDGGLTKRTIERGREGDREREREREREGRREGPREEEKISVLIWEPTFPSPVGFEWSYLRKALRKTW